MKRTNYILLLPASLSMILLASCINEEPDSSCVTTPDDSHVTITYDWSKAREDTPEGLFRRPDGMALMLYPPQVSDYWRYDISAAGGNVNPPEGRYTAVTYNNDTGQLTFFDDKSLSAFGVTTREGQLADGFSGEPGVAQPPAARAAAGERVLLQPEMLWASTEPDLILTKGAMPVIVPVPVVARYSVTVTGIENLSTATSMSMSISGLSAGFAFGEFVRLDEKVTVPGSLTKAGESSVSGSLLTFGVAPSVTPTATLALYFWLRDGRKLMFEFGISDRISDAPDPMDVHITVDGVSLPAMTGGTGSGMDVGVDNWQVIDIELST